ncbi:hypothetical protein A3F07_00945 [candidate division WWE3 bacterium RIFCSPHIGHO2_12_FULL_38_15]|uniref:Uncharacterized protein n=1 Tax=candidate division WWE3 bacterium RIFCSPHIGHO2_02_FULL_38_14 TaxID=1802620 RepID=A0A1F4VA85_UNCKA|nr:MAG: hypothetical protein A2793_03855 [candidate division WWE3 bacterium RIFCSPHIGHO2_01_FULL_38_45]OGC49141.1 MAG: hypothetical protein A3F07_00945 [candidate division WWE3 bacterium RIFCSPHIGHO2_12_FULL_38_15]OGC52593.1 MAG: hypothetical protein A3B64_03460 [candidate division WWE3 bacterium RIFCSPLOWO2_01_FULL_37_24]OGC54084.1 MAG: hypothetical protein A3D91_04985 [candidate division WWE3 bacterium RIFCSPHIGHO2_02_FULL_38_14]HLB51744.1 hypothetical protein [Patescibacteria group bacterium
MRKDYLVERNRKIFEDYNEKEESYNSLSKKYGITPQRIQKIILEYKNKDFTLYLNNNSPKEERERYKNNAVELREAGKLNISLELFNKVKEWDVYNNNLKGQIDVLGHIKIIYKLLSDREKNIDKKLKYLKKASEIIKQSLELAESSDEIKEGTIAIQKVHFANILADTVKIDNSADKTSEVKKALIIIDEALNNLPGSKAHKSWALNTKSQLQFLKGDYNEALNTLNYAESCIFEGYEDELKQGDQAILKLNVWLSGIYLTKALICKETGKNFLTKFYASSVVNIKDPENHLVNRKNQAREILKSLK